MVFFKNLLSEIVFVSLNPKSVIKFFKFVKSKMVEIHISNSRRNSENPQKISF